MKTKKIAVLTYPVKHRKTFDLLSILKANGYEDVIVYAIPFHYQKKRFPLIQHRPEMHFNVPETEVLAKNFGYRYETGALESFQIEQDRIVLVAGAGILPESFVKSHTIINAHPGYIPNCRGLDAFKWAIVEGEPIGVTTHLIGDYIDAGEVIERRRIPINMYDTFHAVAQRVYENEVSMLVEAIEKLDNDCTQMMLPQDYPVHKRMPEDVEKTLLEEFEQYKKTFGEQ
ncbi:MAG: phosphoribosylglycinamide formyltransferase [Clostridia bacterium]|nr:phosphoribosylglycinamide formyltransferase [Clostridia bacterium]